MVARTEHVVIADRGVLTMRLVLPEDLVAELNIGDRVTFYGQVEREEAYRLMKTFDIYAVS